MRTRILPCGLMLALAMPLAGFSSGAGATPGPPASSSVVTKAVLGQDVGVEGGTMYPGFDPDIERYAVIGSPHSVGSLTVTATATSGTTLVNGAPVEGDTELTGLRAGDEVSVIFRDGGQREVHTLIYLPAGFPRLAVSTPQPGATNQPVALTLTTWGAGGSSSNFATVVDRRGVPLWVKEVPAASIDLRRQPNGNLTYSRPTSTSGRTGSEIVELDGTGAEIAAYQTAAPLTHTDNHDSILLANGHRVLAAYEPDGAGRADSVIQEVTADGRVVFQWDTSDFYDETLNPTKQFDPNNEDYAHLNSIELTDNAQNYLISFRHFSSVYKIARIAHDGFEPGDVVWKLGGRDSDFDFVGEEAIAPGPCAQHTASQLANGHILIYDNGSAAFSTKMCVDPADRNGPALARPLTRVTEYALTPGSAGQIGTAELVWSWSDGRFAFFAGSAQRLAGGNTLIGWAATKAAIATEVDPAGNIVWELRDTAATSSATVFRSTYRAVGTDLPDVTDPQVSIEMPTAGQRIELGTTLVTTYHCTDTGGSSLQECTPNPATAGDAPAPGTYDVTVDGIDGAGNTGSRTVSYRVVTDYFPDAALRGPGRRTAGMGDYGPAAAQRVSMSLRSTGSKARTTLLVRNRGERTDRFRVAGARSTKQFGIRYRAGGRDVTRAVVTGRYRTGPVAAGKTARVAVVVTRARAAKDRSRKVFRITATSVKAASYADAVSVKATGR